MLTLAGFDKKAESIAALKESKRQLVEAHDTAIKQVERGVPVDEGLMTGLRAALATVANGTVKATKSIARKAMDLSDNVKKLYQDEKCKIELKEMLKGMVALADGFEKLEKAAPTILKKDERVREIVKVFRDAMDTMHSDLSARALPADRVEPALGESEVKAMLDEFLAEMSSSVDASKTKQAADKLEKALRAQFHVNVETTEESNGSITFELNGGSMAPNSESSNKGILTPSNLSAAIEDTYKEFRSNSWTFTQPIKGKFTIGVGS